MVARDLTPTLRRLAETFPAVTLTGPRQSGKSTLCRALFGRLPYVNLESPDVRAFAQQDPRAFLAQYPDGAILDELQRAPDLASYLQPLIDASPEPGRWILTGSQQFALFESISQSLAGRTAVAHLLPLTLGELRRFPNPPRSLEETLLSGGYPAIHDRGVAPGDWLAAYVATYVERDVRHLANIGDLAAFQRFVQLCAGRTGQLLNYSSLAADAGVSQPTAKAWLSVLEASFLVFRLPAWSGNVNKRLIRMPKLHFYDAGLACWLLGIRTVDHLRSHPLRGALFESWVVSEVAKRRANLGERGGLHFYRDRTGVEIDLLIDAPTELVLIEAKAGETLQSDVGAILRRVAAVVRPAGPARLIVAYAGGERQARSDLTAVPWHDLAI